MKTIDHGMPAIPGFLEPGQLESEGLGVSAARPFDGQRLLLVTDVWSPYKSGVVNTLSHTKATFEALGGEVRMITPQDSKTLPLPFYPEFRMSLPKKNIVEQAFGEFAPTIIHIATEGTNGLLARTYCQQNGLPYTTSFHTKMPQYLKHMLLMPETITWAYLKWFHSGSEQVMVPQNSIREELEQRGFGNLALWGRGVDLELFRPREPLWDLPRPIMLNVGRVSKEKGLDDFLSLDIPGTKVIVGDGPYRQELEQRYPDVLFTGFMQGEKLARAYSSADVFVFPSKTDTFGNVILEALACGTPVAGYPVAGPVELVVDRRTGSLNESLERAVTEALQSGRRSFCRGYAGSFTWEAATMQFFGNTVPCVEEAGLAEVLEAG